MAVRRILLVDDDTDYLDVHTLGLRAAGFEVVAARSAEEALQRVQEGAVHAAVLDVMMSAPDEGFQLARKLRTLEATRTIPLIILSSVNEVNASLGLKYRFSDQDRDPMWLPIDRFLDKPVSMPALVSLLRQLLE